MPYTASSLLAGRAPEETTTTKLVYAIDDIHRTLGIDPTETQNGLMLASRSLAGTHVKVMVEGSVVRRDAPWCLVAGQIVLVYPRVDNGEPKLIIEVAMSTVEKELRPGA